MYLKTPKGNIYHSSSFEFIPKTNKENGEVLAVDMIFNGFCFTLVMGIPSNASDLGIFRPSQIDFCNDGVRKSISLSWPYKKSRHGGTVEFSLKGRYDGDPPDWPVLEEV